MSIALRRLLIGKPIPTERAHHERLNNIQALAVFASDAISSTAYATQEILLVLTAAGQAGLNLTMPVAFAILGLLIIVTLSYQQTIFAYPNGGGSYIVARDNLGELPAQIAGASLLTDYILTVAVSISAGIAAITSAFPSLHSLTVPLCLVAIGVIAWGNLRGARESGTIFAIPTYFFIAMAYLLLAFAVFRYFFHQETPLRLSETIPYHTGEAIGLMLFLRAFASGCSALTGVEAISNGIPAFRRPESRNASKTMISMSLALGTIFIGITWFSLHYGIIYTEHSKETVLSMLAAAVLGRGSVYFLFQIATMAVLIMAANTSYADFPRLASLQAQDGFLPRQLTNLGERLVFNNGILVLTVLAGTLLIIFKGNTDRLIPLYAIGVFLSFTLSQFGMVRRWNRLRTQGWRIKSIINGLGALTTGVVALVVAYTKFVHGAWVVIILIPVLVFIFFQIHWHYLEVSQKLRLETLPEIESRSLSKVLVLVPGIHKGAIPAIEFAKALSPTPIGMHVDVGRDPQAEARLKEDWEKIAKTIPLIIVHSPYREVVRPILEFIDEMKESGGTGPVTVVLPEFVPSGFFNTILHNQTGLMIKWALLFKKDVVLCNVRYHLDKNH
jgi:amino acid transporter